MKTLKGFIDIIVEYWWTIGTVLFAAGFILTVFVFRFTQIRLIAVFGAVLAGIGFLMLIVPLTVDLIESFRN